MATTQSSRWPGCLCHGARARRSRHTEIVIPIKAAPRDVRRVEAQVVAVPPELPRRGSSKSGGSNGAQGTVNDFKEAPEWVKILVIFLTSAVVAFFEFAICKRAPFFWAPAFFLLSFILWRLGLREVGNSNVPARSPDRLFMLALTALIFLWEYTVKRVIVYAPWLSIIVAVLLSPSRQSMDYRERYLSEETLMRAEREYLNRVPVTPKESAAWFGRLLTCFWSPFVEPMLLKTAIVPLQEQVEAAAPQGWTLTLDSFSLGDVAPTLTGWQVFNNSHTGAVEKVTADFSLDTSSLTMGLTGSGPFVGIFSAWGPSPYVSALVWPLGQPGQCGVVPPAMACLLMTALCLWTALNTVLLRSNMSVTLKGISLKGKLQFMPFSSSRLMLFSFVQPPELDVKLNIRGRFIGQQSIPQFAFLRAALVSAVEKDFVEPDRGMVPLDYAPVVGDPLATTLRVKVVAVRYLTIADRVIVGTEEQSQSEDEGAAAMDKQDGVAIEISNPLAALEEQAKAVQVQARGLTDSFVTKVAEAVPAQRAASIRLHLSVPALLLQRTSRMAVIKNDGTAVVEQEFNFQITAPTASLEMRVANERGFTLGTARLQVAHLPDGSTGFWGTAPGGGPIATRLGVEAAPWQAALEVQGTDEAQVELECSTEGWQYSLDQSTPRQFRKGLRSVVAVQVLEGRGIVSKDFNGLSDPYVVVSYNKRDALTRTVWKSLNPVFGDVMLFQENRSMLARRMRLDVLDRDKTSLTGDDSCGWAYINLDLVAEGQVTEQWVQLRGVPSGELRVRLLALSGTDDSNAVREEAVRSLESAFVTYTSDVLKCTVVKVEGLQMGARRRPCLVEVTYGRVIRCTDRRKPNTEQGNAEWDEDLRFRLKDNQDTSSAMLSISVKDAPGTGVNLAGSVIGKASIDASIIIGELDKLRADAVSDGGDKSNNARSHSKLLPSKPLGGLSVKSQKKLSSKAQQVKIASQKGKNPISTRTDIAEAWVPLQGAGSDARLLVRLQGALGERRELARGPLEETARFTQQTLDNFKESSEASAGWISQLQEAGRKVVSNLFD